jgi:hypothetical protein
MTQPHDETIIRHAMAPNAQGVTVKKLVGYAQVKVLGTDEQGRTQIACPACGDTATIMDDGHVFCPTHVALTVALFDGMRGAVQQVTT